MPGQPGAERMDLARLKGGGGQVRGGCLKSVHVISCSRKVEPSLPERGVLRPTAHLLVKPAGSRDEVAGKNRVICAAEPNSIVVLIGHFQGALQRLDWHRRMVR